MTPPTYESPARSSMRAFVQEVAEPPVARLPVGDPPDTVLAFDDGVTRPVLHGGDLRVREWPRDFIVPVVGHGDAVPYVDVHGLSDVGDHPLRCLLDNG